MTAEKTAAPLPAPADHAALLREAEAMSSEVLAQIERGHPQYCVGVHPATDEWPEQAEWVQWDIAAKMLAEKLRSTAAALREAGEWKASTVEACYRVCPDNAPNVPADPDEAQFVCCDENGDPIIEADTPAEVIDRMSELWGKMQERAEASEAALSALSTAGGRAHE